MEARQELTGRYRPDPAHYSLLRQPRISGLSARRLALAGDIPCAHKIGDLRGISGPWCSLWITVRIARPVVLRFGG